jgi:hypothetical protein
LPPDDPLLDLDAFAVEGAGGKLTPAKVEVGRCDEAKAFFRRHAIATIRSLTARASC